MLTGINNEPTVFRSNVCNMLGKRLDDTSICNNLEKGIYNWTLEKAETLNVVKRWDNNRFVQLYSDRLRSVIRNITDPDLHKRLMNKEIKPHKVAFMTHQEMCPEKWREMIAAKKLKDENRYAPRLEASTDNFTCYKCKSKKCSYYQLQTRSADEPMTTFVTCLDCGNRWKC